VTKARNLVDQSGTGWLGVTVQMQFAAAHKGLMPGVSSKWIHADSIKTLFRPQYACDVLSNDADLIISQSTK
jgi:hypothetical protein